jgi:hypothetical protein
MACLRIILGLSAAVVLFGCAGALAAERAAAEVTCRPAATLHYDCIVKLTNARSKEALRGVTLTIGADMPSMAGAHSVRPVTAVPEGEPGSYRARLELEMHGDWALQLNLSGPMRDRIIKVLRFEGDRVTAPPPRAPSSRRGH